MKNNSILNQVSDERFIEIFDKSESYKAILSHYGLVPSKGNYNTLKRRIASLNLDCSKIGDRTKFLMRSRKFSLEEIMTENSHYGTHALRKRLISEGVLEDKCAVCGLPPAWNGQKLSLQLDHINGVSNDHRLENLRIICPNCHTQTHNYSSKNIKRRKDINQQVLIELLTKHNVKDACKILKVGQDTLYSLLREYQIKIIKRYDNRQVRKFDPTREELETDLQLMPMVKIGKKYNVSDNAVKKRCKRLGIEIPKYPVGHWLKRRKIQNSAKLGIITRAEARKAVRAVMNKK